MMTSPPISPPESPAEPPAALRGSPSGASGDDVLELASGLRLAVTRLARRLRQHADTGATLSMLSALSSLDLTGPLTIGELAAREQVSPPTMTSIAARLEATGLVTRETDPADRRVSRLTVSRQGRQLLEKSRSRKTAYLAKRLRLLSAGEREELRRAVGTLQWLLEGEP